MELVINISKWPETSPLEHIRTDIIIKDDNDAIVLEDSITSLVYVKEIDIPVGSTYYVTEKKVFSVKDLPEGANDDLTYESIVHTITNNDEAISNMLLSKPVIVEKPIVMLKLSDIESSVDDVIITSSSFRGSGDGHTHTHWVIKVDGNIVHRSLEDTVNKTSIVIPKFKIKDFTTSLEIYCTHCSNFIESEIEVFKLVKNTLNFKVISNLVNVPLGSYNLKISKINNELPMRLTKVIVKHNDTQLKIFTVNSDNNILDVVLNSILIEPNRTLTIELYGLDSKLELNKKVYTLIPYNLQYEDNINKEYEYEKTFTNRIDEVLLPVGLVTDTIDNCILVPNDNFIDMYLTSPKVTYISSIPSLLHLGNKDNMFIRVNNDNTILIDCLDSNNKPTFLVYEFDTINNVYFLKHLMVRDTETFTVAINNSIEQISNDEFIYSVKGTNKLMKYNKKTNTLVVLKAIPLEDTTDSVILKMDDNQLLILGNGSYHTTIYNIEENRHIDGLILTYSGYVGVSMKKVDLINGDKILLVNTTETNINKVLYFDISKYDFEELDKVIPITDNNLLFRNNNQNMIANVLLKDYIDYMVDRLNINIFQ